MNSNKRANKVTMIDKHYKLLHLSTKVNQSVIQFPQQTNPAENISHQQQNKAA